MRLIFIAVSVYENILTTKLSQITVAYGANFHTLCIIYEVLRYENSQIKVTMYKLIKFLHGNLAAL